MKKLTIVALVMVLCLGAIGIGWAKWTDTITISGTVKTGSVDLVVVDYSGTWVYKDLESDCMIISDEPLDENGLLYVASSWAAPGELDDEVVMTWDNIFPDVPFMADVVFHYQGTIPAKIYEIDLDFGKGSEWVAQYATVEFYKLVGGQWVEMGCPIGYQMHYCDKIMLVVTIELPQDNDLMNLEASATATITVAQWAEGPCNGPEIKE